ncbi:protein kinase domain protein [Ichthyophthirius multifiliis]|uniref:Protein kinase domain protein n=1 Tax=Ichthyophthirius multifiliis TaxID=5932 RepID=G0QR38_ICHMU|nr:protein kinase domain protein [Ichthyophthirius multifiliis]EGR32323.1 protein kinase domain protein [Ichthyophthirius multifiliis]|eukprot:XP_004035809.1 protein kinase domain protein [Ichthyophthirius multifiliis]
MIGLQFINNNIFSQFKLKDKSQYLKWQEILSKQLIQNNFYKYYDVKRVIGSGSYANVTIAQNKRNKKHFAIKNLSKSYIYLSIDGKQEIQNELELMRIFNHKNIMKLIEVFDTDSSIKIVMELVEGGQLQDLIKKKPNMSWQEIGSLIQQILEGIAELHSKNVMHRDIKPENILMRNKEQLDLVIGDFGLATKADCEKYIYLKCGTPGYVAPEIANLDESKISHYQNVCDVFSVGCIFYRLCVHKPLFGGTTHAEVLKENKLCKINLENDQKDLPQEVFLLLKELLEIDPKKRISAKNALQSSFFSNFLKCEIQKNIIPFKGNVEVIKQLHKQEKQKIQKKKKKKLNIKRKKNQEIIDSKSFKMKVALINGKTKQIQAQNNQNNIGSFLSLDSQQHSKKNSIDYSPNKKKTQCSVSEKSEQSNLKSQYESLQSIDEAEEGEEIKNDQKQFVFKSKIQKYSSNIINRINSTSNTNSESKNLNNKLKPIPHNVKSKTLNTRNDNIKKLQGVVQSLTSLKKKK